MNPSKKPRSKPAVAKKAAATPHPDRRLIDGIAARVEELLSRLEAANQKLDFLVVRSAPLKREDWPPLVEQAKAALEKQ